MPVTWSWKHKIGSYRLVQKHSFKDGEVVKETIRKFTINIYEGNCLGVCIWEFRGESNNPNDIGPKTGKRKIVNKYQFMGFWNDAKHLENMLGMHPKLWYGGNCYSKEHNPDDYLESIQLNTYYPQAFVIARRFAKQHFRVTLYYKEPKQPKRKGGR